MRTRYPWLAGSALLVPLGLWLRFAAPVPEQLRDASGGALYVVLWIFVVMAMNPRASALPVAAGVLLATCVIEFSQAWHPAWLDSLRRTVPGRLVLGTTFGWDDFPPYVVGAAIGWALVRAGKGALQKGTLRKKTTGVQ